MIILDEDNIQYKTKKGTYLVAVQNTDKHPNSNGKLIHILELVESNYYPVQGVFIDFKRFPESSKFLIPGGAQYFPFFIFIKDGEIKDLYLGSGVENIIEFVTINLRNNESHN